MQHKLHSCVPSSEADPIPQHPSQFMPHQTFYLLPCSTNYTYSCMPSSEADLDVILTGHPLHPPRCSCLHRKWWEVAAPSSANLGHTVLKQRPAAHHTNTRWSSRHKHQVVSHVTNTRWSVTSRKHQVVGHVTQTPGGQSHHKHQMVGHITHTHQVVSHITNTRWSVMSHKHQVVSHIKTPGGQ